jgi:transcriptional regulator with XRE-family HTH domain
VDLAKAIGVSKDTVRNWESGRSEPRLAVLGRKAVVVVQQLLGSAPGDAAAAPGRQPRANHSSSVRRTLKRP